VRLLSVGRAVEKKGFEDLLEALALLPAHRHWHLEHIGGGDRLPALKAAAERLGLSQRITWRGALAQQDVLKAYRGADLFVLPARIASDGDRDGLPNVLVEAQSQRLACVSTAVSAIPEFIVDGETGCLVPPGETAALAAAIDALIVDPNRRADLGRAGEARVRSSFDAQSGLAQLARLFPPAVQPTSTAGGVTANGTPARAAVEAAQ
jgi:glycosyltransferase involved in cell wall biosynthesis